MIVLEKLDSISTAEPNWYRVKGTRENPLLEPVVVWAALSLADLNETTGEYTSTGYGSAIVGIPSRDFSVQGNDLEHLMGGVAGYVNLAPDQLALVKSDFTKLDDEELHWPQESLLNLA